jgi:hypothetical protein
LRGAPTPLLPHFKLHRPPLPPPPPPPLPLPPGSGEDIKRQQNESTVFLRGPEDSPALKASAAQPRPVVAYTLDKPTPAPAFGSTEAGRALQSSSFSLSQMAPPSRAAHDAPAHVRGGRSAEEAAAASAAMAAATSAAQEAHKAKQRGLTAQWAISQAGGGAGGK